MDDKEFASIKLPEQRWAVPGLFPEGLTVLAAPGKTGKSFLIWNIAGDVAWGDSIFGSFPVNQGDVLYCANEGHISSWQMRLLLMLAARDREPNGRLHFERWWPSSVANGGLRELDSWLSDFPDCRLVVIDVLRNFLPVEGWSQNKDYSGLKVLSDLGMKHHCSIVAVHHTNRVGRRDRDWVERIQGTMGVSAVADCIMMLERDRGQENAVLRVTGKDVSEMALALRFEPENGRFLLDTNAEIDTSGMVHPISDERKEILELVRLNPGLRAPEIAAKLEKKYDNIRLLLWKMKEEMQLRNLGGRYYTPEQVKASKNKDDPQLEFGEVPASILTVNGNGRKQ